MNVGVGQGAGSCSCCGCCCHAMRMVNEFNAPGVHGARPFPAASSTTPGAPIAASAPKSCPMGALAVDSAGGSRAASRRALHRLRAVRWWPAATAGPSPWSRCPTTSCRTRAGSRFSSIRWPPRCETRGRSGGSGKRVKDRLCDFSWNGFPNPSGFRRRVGKSVLQQMYCHKGDDPMKVLNAVMLLAALGRPVLCPANQGRLCQGRHHAHRARAIGRLLTCGPGSPKAFMRATGCSSGRSGFSDGAASVLFVESDLIGAHGAARRSATRLPRPPAFPRITFSSATCTTTPRRCRNPTANRPSIGGTTRRWSRRQRRPWPISSPCGSRPARGGREWP